MLSAEWNNEQPIYRQLRDRVAALIIEGVYVEGEALPSVRQVSTETQINHLTVAKAYQLLVDEGVIEMRRGRGMFVLDGARRQLVVHERQKFIDEELPVLKARLQRLDIGSEELLALLQRVDDPRGEHR